VKEFKSFTEHNLGREDTAMMEEIHDDLNTALITYAVADEVQGRIVLATALSQILFKYSEMGKLEPSPLLSLDRIEMYADDEDRRINYLRYPFQRVGGEEVYGVYEFDTRFWWTPTNRLIDQRKS